jgi:hypothetical protein
MVIATRDSLLALAACCLIPLPAVPAEEDRATAVRKDRTEITAEGRWIYNDLPKGLDEARRTGKPLLVVLRCIPCQACRGFDEDVAGFDLRVQALLESFVRVRIPQANGLDLSLFQFDYDLSFYAFFLNADRTIYGRFGSRSTQKDKTGEVSMDAFREAMRKVLALHAKYGEVKDSLRGKHGPPPQFKTPEDYPPLKGKYKPEIDYEGKVLQSCIHCHMVRDAERSMARSRKEPIPDQVLFPWPEAAAFGLHLDPRKAATAARVEPASAAERAGFQRGDELAWLEGQPIVSTADVEWVLHHAPEKGALKARVLRDGKEVALEVPLEPGWRKRSDVSWRATTWDLRRMGTGGLLLEEASAEERKAAGVPEGKLALKVKHAGEYGEHAAAKNAGVSKGDIVVAVDGRRDPLRETDLIAYAVQKKMPGDRLELTIVHEGQEKTVGFVLQ